MDFTKILNPDNINAFFIYGGSFFILMNCIELYRAKLLSGVSLFSLFFYTVWGMFNAYYYADLGKIQPMLAEVAISVLNIMYFIMALKFYKNPE